MSERGCRSPTHRSRSATPSKRVLQKLRNKCSITPEQPLHYPRNGCSIWIGTGAPLRPEGAGADGAHEKGGVEGEIGRFRRRHFVPVPRVGSLGELNELIK